MVQLNLIHIILISAFFLVGCGPTIPHYDHITPTGIEPPESFQKFGAYYEIDETRIVGFFGGPKQRTVYNRIEINRQIRFLHQEGVQYGTISMPKIPGVYQFVIQRSDNNGPFQQIDSDPIQENFEKVGTVILPNVRPGSRFHIQIIGKTLAPLYFFEQWFTRTIPVERSKFSIAANISKDWSIVSKTYGNGVKQIQSPLQESEWDEFAWQAENILPIHHQDFLARSQEIPRVSIALFAVPKWAKTGKWDDLAEGLDKYIQRNLSQENYGAYDLLNQFISKNSTDMEKADAILKYIQENYQITGSQILGVHFKDLIREKKGTSWQISLLMESLFRYAGLSPKLVVCRGLDEGGLDPEFPTLAALDLPLLITEISKINHAVAFPFNNAFSIGEYPLNLHGQSCLDIADNSIVKLPAPYAQSYRNINTTTINMNNPQLQKHFIHFTDYAALHMRSMLNDQTPAKQREIIQKRLSEMDSDYRLDSLALLNFDKRGSAIQMHVTTQNKNLIIERKDKKMLQLKALFETFFSRFDTTATQPFHSILTQDIRETVRLNSIQVEKIDFRCEDMTNELFTVRCSQVQDDIKHTLELSRTLQVHKTSISHHAKSNYISLIEKLNEIRASSIQYKTVVE